MAKRPKRQGRKRRQNQVLRLEFVRFKKWVSSLLGLLVAMVLAISVYAKEELLWHKSDRGIDETKITAISIIKDVPKVIYAGGGRSIYKSVDSGESWHRVFMLKGERKGINFITYDPQDSYRIFAATNDGLYISNNRGKAWKRYFRGRGDLQRDVSCIAIDEDDPSFIFIGTRRGLFQSRDLGRHWSAHNNFINKEVSSVAIGNKAVYVSAIDGVYSAKKGSDLWERIYVCKASEEENSNSDKDERISRLNHINIYGDSIYLATDKGIFICKEKDEKGWEMFNSEGLLTRKIRSVLCVDKGMFAATDKGIFFYNEDNRRWNSMSSGLATLSVNFIDFTPEEELLYAACDKGVYKTKLNKAQTEKRLQQEYMSETIISKEPAISEIQKAAIEYAEVSPEKIEWMRRSAGSRAWLPRVTAALDGDIYRTLDLDRGSTSTYDFYIEGPKDKRWGWDISATWDLDELIWSDDQTNIDVRSRLMVQLRNDVLDEVTKLYFERRRLQYELYNNPPKAEKQKSLKQLRLEELTASIDGLTGGYLSERIKDTRLQS